MDDLDEQKRLLLSPWDPLSLEVVIEEGKYDPYVNGGAARVMVCYQNPRVPRAAG